MNATILLRRTRDIIADRANANSTIKYWEDDEVLRNINGAYEALWRAARLADSDYGLRHALLSSFNPVVTEHAGNLLEVRLGQTVENIQFLKENVAADFTGDEIVHVPVGQSRSFRGDWVWRHDSTRAWWAGQPRILYFTKTGRTFDATKIRIWYLLKAPRLVRFRCTIYPTTSQLQIQSNVDTLPANGGLGDLGAEFGYYSGTEVECIDNGNADPQSLRFIVTAYLRSGFPNFLMTFEIPHGLAAGTTIWENLHIFGEEHDDLIALLAARRCFMKGGDVEQARVIDMEVRQDLADFKQIIEDRQMQEPRSVNFSEHI